VIVTHMRPEPTLGILRRLDTGPQRTRWPGYVAHGGTLDDAGMLFANRCTWAHVAAEAADALGVDAATVLGNDALAAVRGLGDPRSVMAAA
jgi:hypothetical protein